MVYAAVARTRMYVETIYNAVIRISKPVNGYIKLLLGRKIYVKTI